MSWLSCTRVLMDIGLSSPAPSQILINLSDGRSIWQDIVYEDRLLICGGCHRLGHKTITCPGAQQASVLLAGSLSVVAHPPVSTPQPFALVICLYPSWACR